MGVGAYCASTDATSPAYAGRCFNLTPTIDGAARVRLWARTSELNGIAEADLAVYRLTVSGWGELGSQIIGSDGDSYRYAEGDAPGFSGFLLGEAGSPPVPVTLQSFQVVYFDARDHRLFGLQ